jgi:hypothetical protein
MIAFRRVIGHLTGYRTSGPPGSSPNGQWNETRLSTASDPWELGSGLKCLFGYGDSQDGFSDARAFTQSIGATVYGSDGHPNYRRSHQSCYFDRR